MKRNVIYKIIVAAILIFLFLFTIYESGQADGIGLLESLKQFIKKVIDEGSRFSSKILSDGFEQFIDVQNFMMVIILFIGGAAIVILNILDKKERPTHKRASRWLYRKKSIKSLEIDIDDELNEYEITFRSLCGKAGVYKCRFLYDGSSEKDIYSFQEKSDPPCIVLTRGFIEGLKRDISKSEMREGAFKFVVAHELGHIRYDDNINLSWRMTICGLLFLGGMFVCLVLGTPLFSATKTGAIVLVFVIVLWLLMFFTLCYPNYWSQVQEFRADIFCVENKRGTTSCI